MPSAANRVLIYDTSNLQCELLAASLERLRPQLEVKCICDSESMIALLMADPGWVVIVSDPGQGTTASLVNSLRTRSIEVPFVFLLPEGSTERVIDALRLGARGIVYGSDNLSQLAACIDRVSQGQVWLKHVNLGIIFDRLAQPGSRVPEVSGRTQLSSREDEISRLVAEGMSNREVSRSLRINESTVKNALCHIYEKLGVSNRVELTLRVSGNAEAESA
jgi:two-component system nitrate/nitrite response regulator NarL